MITNRSFSVEKKRNSAKCDYYQNAPFEEIVLDINLPKTEYIRMTLPRTDEWIDISDILVPKHIYNQKLNPFKILRLAKRIIKLNSLDMPIIIDRQRVLISGWMRLLIASKMGWAEVPVMYKKTGLN